MNTPTVTPEDLWKQYGISVDLYKHYLKLTIEVNAFYYAISGALLSYYFAHRGEESIRYALVLPILMSLMLCALCCRGAWLNRITRIDVFRIRDALGLVVAPDFAILSWLLWISAVLMFTVAVGLVALLLGSPIIA